MTSRLDKPATPQEALEHAGVKGMKWGQRKSTSSGSSSSVKKKTSAPKSSRFSPRQKQIAKVVAVRLVAGGAAAAATMMGGPMAGVSVGALGGAFSTTRTVNPSNLPVLTSQNTSGMMIDN